MSDLLGKYGFREDDCRFEHLSDVIKDGSILYPSFLKRQF